LGDVERALLHAARFAIRTGREDRKRLVVDARDHVTDTQAAARKAKDRVELVAGLVDLQRELFDEEVVFLPGDMQILHHALRNRGIAITMKTGGATRSSVRDPGRWRQDRGARQPLRSDVRDSAGRSRADRSSRARRTWIAASPRSPRRPAHN